LKDDSTFIQELFARLKSPTTSQESKKNLVSLDEDIVLFASLCLYLERKAIPPYGPHHPPPYILYSRQRIIPFPSLPLPSFL